LDHYLKSLGGKTEQQGGNDAQAQAQDGASAEEREKWRKKLNKIMKASVATSEASLSSLVVIGALYR
jgi:hypothetical protein